MPGPTLDFNLVPKWTINLGRTNPGIEPFSSLALSGGVATSDRVPSLPGHEVDEDRQANLLQGDRFDGVGVFSRVRVTVTEFYEISNI
jgi:hypothetical protein